MLVKIGFKNGKEIGVDCKEFSIQRNKYSGEIVRFSYKSESDTLFYVDFAEILYVIGQDQKTGDDDVHED